MEILLVKRIRIRHLPGFQRRFLWWYYDCIGQACVNSWEWYYDCRARMIKKLFFFFACNDLSTGTIFSFCNQQSQTVKIVCFQPFPLVLLLIDSLLLLFFTIIDLGILTNLCSADRYIVLYIFFFLDKYTFSCYCLDKNSPNWLQAWYAAECELAFEQLEDACRFYYIHSLALKRGWYWILNVCNYNRQ